MSSIAKSKISKYLIEVFKPTKDAWVSMGHATCYLRNQIIPEIEIIDDDYNTLFKTEIKKNAYLEERPSKDGSGFTARLKSISGDLVCIKFDTASVSSYKCFISEFISIRDSTNEILLYSSGNIKYTGSMLNGVCNGVGILFYDRDKPIIKYLGDFENGHCDGAGIFYDLSGRVLIRANCISRSVPNGWCSFIIRDDNDSILYKKDFEWKSEFVNEIFENKLFYTVAKTCGVDLDEYLYQSSSTDKKMDIIMTRITHMMTRIKRIEKLLINK